MIDGTATTLPLGEEVYRSLRSDIISGRLRSGAPLRESELAARFAISRTPVRQALQRLEAEGLVIIEPARGARIAEVSLREVMEVYEIRELLEPHAAAMAARRRLQADIARLQALRQHLEQAASVLDVESRQQLDIELHSLITEIAGNLTLQATIQQLRARTERGFSYIAKDYYRSSFQEHVQLIDALIAGNPELARQVMVHHLQAARTHLVSPGDLRPDPPPR